MEKRITSKHEDGCLMGKEVRNEKREVKETADHESRDGGYFWNGYFCDSFDWERTWRVGRGQCSLS